MNSVTLERLAEEVWLDAPGSVDAAVLAMRRRLRADVALYRALIDPLITSALRRAVERVARTSGRHGGDDETPREAVDSNEVAPRFFTKSGLRGSEAPYARATARQSSPTSALIQGLRQVAEQNLLAFVLVSGKPLGDATRDEVLADSNARMRRTATECRWLGLIAARLSTSTAIVRQEFQHEQLADLRRQAEELFGDQWVFETLSEHVAGSTSDDERDPATSAPLASVVALVPPRGARG